MTPSLSASARSAARWAVDRVARLDRAMSIIDIGVQEVCRVREERLAEAPVQTLYQMRRALPPPERPTISVRPVRPGADEADLAALSQRAFAWMSDHERARLQPDALGRSFGDRDFDPAAFLVFEEEGRPAGYCWTREIEGGRLGLIDTLAVDPEAHGRGLGRQLCLAGLWRLTDRGLPAAAVYVDAANVRAVKLYVGLGFVVHRVDRRYGAAPPAPL